MTIWRHLPDIEEVNQIGANSMVELLGIIVTEIGEDYLKGTMPVDNRTLQPHGILHGGASVALAETLGSIASTLCLDTDKQYCVGLGINSSHVRPISSGKVTGTVKPVHVGRTIHVWNIDISADHGKLISVSRLTMAILNKSPGS